MPSPRPTLAREAAVWADGGLLIGVDEVGRGPLAGPVVAAAVVFPFRQRFLRGLRDSKVLRAAERAAIARRIRRSALHVGVGAASIREIDRLNIRVATALAMRRAVATLCRAAGAADALPDGFRVLLDGLPMPELGYAHEALVDGDARCHSIAAAGVLAKTVRDELMRRLAARYPVYGWATNMGYATAAHLEAIQRHGPTRHHRWSFSPVSQLELPGLA